MTDHLLFDGNSLYARAFFGVKRQEEDGTPIDLGDHFAIYEFINRLTRLIDRFAPAYVAIAFDGPNLIRRKFFPTYKTQRNDKPPGYYPQLEKLKTLLFAIEVPFTQIEGYEADDLLYTWSIKASPNETSIIVTGDHDLLQCVSSSVSVFMMKWSRKDGDISSLLSEPKDVKEMIGVLPDRVVDYKILAGDSSDNFPGFSRIGPAKAISLLEKFGSLEAILEPENIAALTTKAGRPAAIQRRLMSGARNREEMRKLAQLYEVMDLPLPKISTTSKMIHKKMEVIVL